MLVGTLAAFLLRTLCVPSAYSSSGLALVAVILPLGAVLVSGLVMFHMGDDADFIFITCAVTAIGLLGAFVLARNIVRPLETIRKDFATVGIGRPQCPCPRGGTDGTGRAGSFVQPHGGPPRGSL